MRPLRSGLRENGCDEIMKRHVTSLLPVLVFTVAACSSKSDQPGSNASATEAGSSANRTNSEESKMGSMDDMAPMTGDPDRDFLRMMGDHHKGMLLMTEPALAKGITVKDEAQRIATDQKPEIGKMTAILKSAYSDSYEPKVMSDGRKMAGELDALTGTALDRMFLEKTILHHKAAIKMVDEYLPKAKNSEVKTIAEKIKKAQLKEIKEFEGKLAAL